MYLLDSCDCDEFGAPLAKRINNLNIQQATEQVTKGFTDLNCIYIIYIIYISFINFFYCWNIYAFYKCETPGKGTWDR